MNGQDLITESWNYIAYWLDNKTVEYVNSNSLAGGVSEETLKQFQEELNIDLPVDFCLSYLMHNGFKQKTGLMHGGDLLSIAEIKKIFSGLVRKKQGVEWDMNMLPFVAFNELDFMCLDLKDNRIYWAEIDTDEKTVKSYKTYDSFSGFLSGLANDLKEGNGSMGEMLGK